MKNVEHTGQFTVHGQNSVKCIGLGNNRKSSVINAKVRQDSNTKRRQYLKKDLEKQIDDTPVETPVETR